MKTAALILNIIMLIGLIPSAFMAMMSPMMSDSGVTTRTWVLMISAMILPILIVISQVFAWIFYAKGNFYLAFKIALIPFLDVLFLIGMFMYSDKLT